MPSTYPYSSSCIRRCSVSHASKRFCLQVYVESVLDLYLVGGMPHYDFCHLAIFFMQEKREVQPTMTEVLIGTGTLPSFTAVAEIMASDTPSDEFEAELVGETSASHDNDGELRTNERTVP